MAGIVFEIKQYMVVWRQLETRSFDSTTIQVRGIVRCTGDEYSLEVFFLTDDSAYPNPVFKPEQKKGFMFLPFRDMLAFVDLLRNEKPVYGHLNAQKPQWISVTTASEPVGEEES